MKMKFENLPGICRKQFRCINPNDSKTTSYKEVTKHCASNNWPIENIITLFEWNSRNSRVTELDVER